MQQTYVQISDSHDMSFPVFIWQKFLGGWHFPSCFNLFWCRFSSYRVHSIAHVLSRVTRDKQRTKKAEEPVMDLIQVQHECPFAKGSTRRELCDSATAGAILAHVLGLSSAKLKILSVLCGRPVYAFGKHAEITQRGQNACFPVRCPQNVSP